MKTFLIIIVLAFISMLTTVLYGKEHLNSNKFSYQFPLQIRAIYNIEKQENKEGISRDRIAILEENHKKALCKSEVHPKSWTQLLRCIFYEERTPNQPSV